MRIFICTLLLSLCSVVASGDTKTRDCDVGELNKRAVYMPIVAYPLTARHIGGVVRIQVRINRNGNVVKTQVLSGPKQLRAAALRSARRARFDPSLAACESSRFVVGTLVYTFIKQGTGGKT